MIHVGFVYVLITTSQSVLFFLFTYFIPTHYRAKRWGILTNITCLFFNQVNSDDNIGHKTAKSMGDQLDGHVVGVVSFEACSVFVKKISLNDILNHFILFRYTFFCFSLWFFFNTKTVVKQEMNSVFVF